MTLRVTIPKPAPWRQAKRDTASTYNPAAAIRAQRVAEAEAVRAAIDGTPSKRRRAPRVGPPPLARRETAGTEWPERATPAQLAAVLGVPERTARRWHAAGALPPRDARLYAILAGQLAVGFEGWRGWSIAAGELRHVDGYTFAPGDILAAPFERARIKALQTRVAQLEAENAELRGAANDADARVPEADVRERTHARELADQIERGGRIRRARGGGAA